MASGSTGSARTYPKSGANPSKSVGKQKSSDWPEGDRTSYPGGGSKATVENTDRCHTLECSGGTGSPAKASYPNKAARKFGCTKHVGS